MTGQAKLATWIVSGYLVVYVVFLWSGIDPFRQIAVAMFFLSPVLVVWLAFTVVRRGMYRGRELGDGEEFGYGDRETKDLWIL